MGSGGRASGQPARRQRQPEEGASGGAARLEAEMKRVDDALERVRRSEDELNEAVREVIEREAELADASYEDADYERQTREELDRANRLRRDAISDYENAIDNYEYHVDTYNEMAGNRGQLPHYEVPFDLEFYVGQSYVRRRRR